MKDNRPLWRRRLVEHANLLCMRDSVTGENVIGPMILNLLDVFDQLKGDDKKLAEQLMARLSPMQSTNIDAHGDETVETVADLKKRIASLPDNLRVVGYNGSGDDRPVTVYVNDFEDVDDGTNPEPALIVNTD